ncbi:unnamed protein product, partial [Laminaria digitata]
LFQESRTSNIAREAGMGAGIPVSVPSHTVTQACVSGGLAWDIVAAECPSSELQLLLL